MTRRLFQILLIVATALALPLAAQDRESTVAKAGAPVVVVGERRIALVIGNARYKESPLVNAINDARAIARALTKAGFKVTEKEDLSLAEMQVALRDFGDALKNGGVGLFYYAGHGMQVKARNFLIPVDARIQREDEVPYNSVDAGQVLDKMEAANNRLNIVILDACRNNPFPRSFRSGSVGLAQMDAPVGTLVAFATAPGSVASDGSGQNGLYTQHLLRAMQQPGIKIEDVFKNVRAGVRRDSEGRQVPWESTSLEGDFVFLPRPPVPAAASPVAAGPAAVLDSVAMPQLKVGDSWQYQTIDLLSGSVINRYTRTLTATTADEWRFGGYVTDRSGNLLRISRDGTLTVKWTPRRPTYDFPLQVGKTWTAVGGFESDKLTSEHAFTFKVIRQEPMVVPAGLFDTLRVEGSSKYKSTSKKNGSSGEGVSTHRYWFSPLAGRIVAYEYEETNWKGVLHKKTRDELIAYQRRGG